jgi:acyl carrier protein
MTTQTDAGQQIRATVLQCWSGILELPDDAINDDSNFFFDGGDSLLAVELVSTASTALGVEIPVDSLFLDGTFGAFVTAAVDAVSGDRA